MPLFWGLRSAQISGSSSIAASPGFTWGKSGNVTAGAYLLNDTVPSNLSGRIVPVYDGIIEEVFVACEDTTTVVFAVEKRTDPGPTYTELLTISLTSERVKLQSFTVSASRPDELCVKVKSGSAKNPVLGVIIKGDSA